MGRTELRCLSAVTGLVVWTAASVGVAGQVQAESKSACVGCHAGQTIHQAETPMGQAMLLPGSNLTLKARPTLSLRNGAYTYTIETKGNQTTYTVSDSTRKVSLPIRWTFGKRMQTWILEHDGRYYESRVSYYPSRDGIEITVGEERLTPRTLDEAIGRELKHREVTDCFGCHSSNAVSKGQLTLDSLQPGVTCEHCHSDTSAHLLDAFQGMFDSTPRQLKNLQSEEISDFCGQCHRTWETVIRNGIRGVANVRFQPYRLANSKCFNGADSRIACTACHDPHQDLVRDDANYDKFCLACHASKSHSADFSTHADAKSCPVASANCVSCHMPKTNVNTPGGLLTFTDHQIRVVRQGEPYPN